MVSEQMCIGPLKCRTNSGECCSVLLVDGSVICPATCSVANSRQADGPGAPGLQGNFLNNNNILQLFFTQEERDILDNIFGDSFGRQNGVQEGYSLQSIFQVSLVGATLFNTFGGLLTPLLTSPTTVTTTTTMPTIVPVMTMSMLSNTTCL